MPQARPTPKPWAKKTYEEQLQYGQPFDAVQNSKDKHGNIDPVEPEKA